MSRRFLAVGGVLPNQARLLFLPRMQGDPSPYLQNARRLLSAITGNMPLLVCACMCMCDYGNCERAWGWRSII